jgi:hypothetical protein
MGYPTIKDWENVSLMRLSSSLPDVSHVFSSPQGGAPKIAKLVYNSNNYGL